MMVNMSNCSVAKKKKTVKRSHLNQNAINEIFDNFELSFKKLLLAFFRALVGAVYNYFLSFCRQDQTLASITISFERQKITLKLKILIEDRRTSQCHGVWRTLLIRFLFKDSNYLK